MREGNTCGGSQGQNCLWVDDDAGYRVVVVGRGLSRENPVLQVLSHLVALYNFWFVSIQLIEQGPSIAFPKEMMSRFPIHLCMKARGTLILTHDRDLGIKSLSFHGEKRGIPNSVLIRSRFGWKQVT